MQRFCSNINTMMKIWYYFKKRDSDGLFFGSFGSFLFSRKVRLLNKKRSVKDAHAAEEVVRGKRPASAQVSDKSDTILIICPRKYK